MHESQDKPGVEERLDQVEAKLIESEHRLYAALRNFVHRNDWPKGDPRRRAAWMALFWVWFAPVTIAVGGGAATLGVLIWQGLEISKQSTYFKNQNDLFADQLKKMDTQIREAKVATREAERTHLIDVLWGVKEMGFLRRDKVPVASRRMREEAFARFLEIERERLREEGAAGVYIDLTGALLSGIVRPRGGLGDASEVLFTEADLSGANLGRADLTGANLFRVNLDGADIRRTVLIDADLREANLHNVNLTAANLSEAILSKANLTKAHLREANLTRAFLQRARLVEADLSKAYLREANLDGADLRGADLRGACLESASLARTVLDRALVDTPKPTWLDSQQWRTEPIESDFLGNAQWRILPKADMTTTSQPATGQTPARQEAEESLDRE